MTYAVREYDFNMQETSASSRTSSRFTPTGGSGPVGVKRRQQPVEIGPFTKLPNQLFSSGMARILKPSATVLYAALCETANRHGRGNTFKTSDKALASETALSPRNICDARKRLLEQGMITVTREKGQSYVYTLTLQSLKWVGLAERPRIKLQPRAYHARKTIDAEKREP